LNKFRQTGVLSSPSGFDLPFAWLAAEDATVRDWLCSVAVFF
jgi:hypothetical protein